MKRIIFLVLIVALITTAFGCSSSASGVLDKDEFNVYQNGKLFMEIPEDGPVMVNLNTESEMSPLHEYDGQIFTTKQGIAIGDSIDQVKSAYKGISLMILDQMSGELLAYDEVPRDNNGDRNIYEVRIRTLIINGKLYDGLRSEKEIMDELRVDIYEWAEIKRFDSEEYNVEDYSMRILFEDNKVVTLALFGMTSEIWNK